MTSGDEETDTTVLAPDEAFAVLGNETRMQIIQTLGAVEDPLSFSDLRERVGMPDSGQFNYHLDRLTGHFIRKTPEGYSLRQSGERVIEAILSGAVTESPQIAPTQLDEACPYCGADIHVGFQEERVELFCPNCTGTYPRDDATQALDAETTYGYLGGILLPPAGVQDRTPAEITQAAITWANSEFAAAASGVCPRCSARFTQSVEVCADHDPVDGRCPACGRRFATLIINDCTNCNFGYSGSVLLTIVNHIEFLSFLVDHDINPVTPTAEQYIAIDLLREEELLSLDPFEGRYTFTIGDDALSVTLDEALTVVDATRHPATTDR